jgi:hypothetical protein
MTANGGNRAREGPGSRGSGSPTMSTNDSGGGDRRDVVVSTVTASDLLDISLTLREAAWRDGYTLGAEHGRAAGYAAAEADMAASWREIAEPIAHPERYAAQRIRAAIAAERRDAAEHERSFAARARNTPEHSRTDPQRATVYLCPPPQRKAG